MSGLVIELESLYTLLVLATLPNGRQRIFLKPETNFRLNKLQ
jgi:hypothetical protein